MSQKLIPLLREAISVEKPLQLIGVINAYCALLAEQLGFKALYLSGAGIANADLGIPDLGMTSLEDVLSQVRRITSRISLPLVVDADTGFGSSLNIYRSFYELSKAGASGAHIEDQKSAKRCGHREGKKLVSKEIMGSRLKAALDGRYTEDFMVIARTDALSVEGVEKTLERACYYQDIGADMLFLEAANDLAIYQTFTKTLRIPVLANITEFGQTPLFNLDQLKSVGVGVALYPLSVFRAMNFAAIEVLKCIRNEGTQKSVLNKMQTRDELYDTLDYINFEKKIDKYLENVQGEE
ncbi:MAG TPA: methylisocitrate lyase [Gammaproteobacteria bacterium]|nr:methylisocitrate lyase [Gammaproteobacteria bacterium]